MPRKRRIHAPGLVFHVLNRAAKRAVLFNNQGDYAAFERLLAEAVQRFDIALYAYCIMPNHWHLLLMPRADGVLSRFMHWMTTTHARRWQNVHGACGLGAVYQGRFKAIPIAHDRHFLWVCRYVERNPLRASLVTRAEEWRWSSLQRRGSAWVSEWPVGRPSDWVSHVNVPQTDAEVDHFRHAVRLGQPFGDDDWIRETNARIGTPPRRPPGRPRRCQPATSVL